MKQIDTFPTVEFMSNSSEDAQEPWNFKIYTEEPFNFNIYIS